MTEETRRSAERHRTLKGAKITFNGGRSTITCIVRNLSEGGALLRVESVVGIPDEFILSLDHGPRLPSRVVWRRATELGVEFARQ